MLAAGYDVAVRAENGPQFQDAARSLDSDIGIAEISMPEPRSLRSARRGRPVLAHRAPSGRSRTLTPRRRRPDRFFAPSSRDQALGCVNKSPGGAGLRRSPRAVPPRLLTNRDPRQRVKLRRQ